MENLVKLVGKNIRGIRKMKDLTQEDLAERSGHQTTFVAGVERGERNITLQTLEKIIYGLDEDSRSFFNFNIDQTNLSKNEKISLLVNLLSDKTEDEIELIYKISRNIFETYKYTLHDTDEKE